MGTTSTKMESIYPGTVRIEFEEMRIVETESFVERHIEDDLDGTWKDLIKREKCMITSP